MKTGNKRRLNAMLKELGQVNDHIGRNSKLISARELQGKKDERHALVNRINRLLGDEQIPQDSLISISVNNTLKDN